MKAGLPVARLAVAGPSRLAAPLARDLLAAGLPPPAVLGRTPGESAEAVAHLAGRALALATPEEAGEPEAIVLAGLEAGEMDALCSRLSLLSGSAVVIVAGARSCSLAESLLRSSRIPPHRVIATGALPHQRRIERLVAMRAGVSRGQVSAPVAARGDGPPITLWRYARIAGIPASEILGKPVEVLTGEVAYQPDEGEIRRAAVTLAGSILLDLRRVLSFGHRIPPGRGIAEGVGTLPGIVGREGLTATLDLALTMEERSFLNRE